MIRTQLSHPTDWRALGTKWRAFETECDGSFFQSWTWLGCMVEDRFPDPVLIEAFADDRLIGLALFNRRRGRLHLSETGEPELDSLTVEHNGVLAARDHAEAARAACIRTARDAAKCVVMSGIGSADRRIAEASGPFKLHRTNPAPRIDVASLRAGGRPYLSALSANTRYQITRSQRRYAETGGPLKATLAASLAEALAFLDALVELHTARWQARGKPGAFASPRVRRFHAELLRRGFDRGEIEMWRVGNEVATVGYLYNFRYHEIAMAYQSGFADAADGRLKPGLTCHSIVIETHMKEHLSVYDLLAGDHRYKGSLASGSEEICWMSLAELASPTWVVWKLEKLARYIKYATFRLFS